LLSRGAKSRRTVVRATLFVAVTSIALAAASSGGLLAGSDRGALVAQVTPQYVTWYYATPTPTPSPITGAYAAIGGALGAGNVYNTATNGFGTNGSALLSTGGCFFLCYGSPGNASANVLAMGNDVVSSYSFTTLGAPDDCGTSPGPPCPAGIHDSVFALEYYASPTATPTVLLAIDASANLAASSNIYAGAAVVAGAGTGTPEPSPSAGSLVSHTGAGTGDILLGSSGTNSYVKCDYGETEPGELTCDEPFVVSSGGIQPNGSAGGYAPEAFPQGTASPHPEILTGSCAVTAPSTACTFPNQFAFHDTAYNCAITGQGSTAAADSYVKSSASEITIYSGTSATFSYTCME
jgi:hypothetical protein